MKSLVQTAVVLAVVAATGLFQQSPAAAATQGPFLIVSYQSLRCIDNPHGATANNVTMIIWNCDTTHTNQHWYFDDTDAGHYWIRNRVSNKCLTVLNNSTADNAPVVQYTCNRGDNEEWRPSLVLPSAAGDWYTLINRRSQKCLTVKNASVDNGATLLQFTCNRGLNQMWTWG